jgi:hypothetical protein
VGKTNRRHQACWIAEIFPQGNESDLEVGFREPRRADLVRRNEDGTYVIDYIVFHGVFPLEDDDTRSG